MDNAEREILSVLLNKERYPMLLTIMKIVFDVSVTVHH